MNPLSWAKLAGAAVIVLAIIVAGIFIHRWRRDALELPQVRQQFEEYKAEVARGAQEQQRRSHIDAEVTKSYLTTIEQQQMDLRDARERLRTVSLHVNACPDVQAGAPAAAATGADAQSTNRQPAVVAPAAQSAISAEAIAERFSACDDVAARLNALIDRAQRQRASD